MCSASSRFPSPNPRTDSCILPLSRGGGQALIFSHKLHFPRTTLPTRCWGCCSQRAVCSALSPQTAALPASGAQGWDAADAAEAAPPLGRAGGRERLRQMFVACSSKALDAAAAGCDKAGACQHHAEGLDASHRQKGQSELIKMQRASVKFYYNTKVGWFLSLADTSA